MKAQKRRSRPKARKIDADPVLKARVLADLKRSRTPRQIVGRLRAEACDGSLEPCKGSRSGCVPRAVYTWIYALLTRRTGPSQESCLRSRRTRGRPRHPVGQRTHPGSWGWSALVDHPLRMWLSVGHLGHWQVWHGSLRDPIGASAAATLVERTTRIRG